MAGATPPGEGLQGLVDRLLKLERLVKSALRPNGSQTGSSAFISTSGDSSVGGDSYVAGSQTVAGGQTVSGAASFPYAYNNTVSSSTVAAYLGGSGDNYRLGRSASSRRYKQDITPMQVDPAAVAELELVKFRWVEQVDEHGDQAGWDFGLVAEDVEAAGLTPWVFHGPEGEPEGVHYDRLGLALLPIVQQLVRDVAAANQRIADLQTQIVTVNVKKGNTL